VFDLFGLWRHTNRRLWETSSENRKTGERSFEGQITQNVLDGVWASRDSWLQIEYDFWHCVFVCGGVCVGGWGFAAPGWTAALAALQRPPIKPLDFNRMPFRLHVVITSQHISVCMLLQRSGFEGEGWSFSVVYNRCVFGRFKLRVISC